MVNVFSFNNHVKKRSLNHCNPYFAAMEMDASNDLFDLAARFVNQTNRHLFLTGRAGTGKTTFLKFIRDTTFKKMVIVAPTGVAAINAGGVTMHSFFQLPFGPYVPVRWNGWNESIQVNDPHSLFKGIRFNAAKRELLLELELLVIDEVSMLRADMLDATDLILRHFRQQPNLPFGGVQVLFIGDLFQLPPVVKNDEWNLLKEHYNSPFFFDAHVVRQSPPLYLELKKIYRQTEQDFINILNNIRNNLAGADDLEQLHQHYHPGYRPAEEEHYITLTTHNVKADAINRKALDALPGKSILYEGKVSGDFSDKAFPADLILELKEGAQVMFIRNDKGENRRYYNGKIATVSRIEKDKIFVGFPGEQYELELEKETWKNIRYTFNTSKNTIEEDELGTFSQFPIRLAWAITIHKSQGLTFEKAIIDAGQAFAAGQVYVALSRLTKLNGLILYSRIYPHCISTDERVIAFTKTEKEHDELNAVLLEEQQRYAHSLLIRAYNWVKVSETFPQHIEQYEGKSFPGKEDALDWAKQLQLKLNEEQEVTEKFSRQLEQLISNVNATGYEKLHERMHAASGYFVQKLDEIIHAIEQHRNEYKGKPRIKKYLEDCRKVSLAFERKKEELLHAVQLAKGLLNGSDLGEFLSKTGVSQNSDEGENTAHADNDIHPVIPKPKKELSREITLSLFREGKSIDEICAHRELARSTVEGHLMEFIPTGEIGVELFLDNARLEEIIKVINSAKENEGNGFVKAQLGESFSYRDIRAAREYLKTIKNVAV
jgi:hypothetical protein